jgi:hypothetical protein
MRIETIQFLLIKKTRTSPKFFAYIQVSVQQSLGSRPTEGRRVLSVVQHRKPNPPHSTATLFLSPKEMSPFTL